MSSQSLLLILCLLPSCVLAARAPKLLDTVWSTRADYPIPVLEAGGAVLRDALGRRHLVVAGGYISNSGLKTTSAVYALPMQSNAGWRRLADMPLDLTHVAQAAVETRFYTCGGFVGTAPGKSVADCFVFHLPNNTWSRMPSLPSDRAGGGMVYIEQSNALFYASGTQRPFGEYVGIDKAESWMLFLADMEKGWVRKNDMPNPRNHMVATSVGGRYYFLGGQHQNRETTDNQATVQEYDFWKDVWVSRKPMPIPVGHISASTVAYWNGILVIGGINNGRLLSNRVHYYDIFADTWTFVGRFPRNVQSPVCDKADRQLFCATGEGQPGNSQAVYFRTLTLPM